ncbi:MAG: transcriptional repressor LexA [Anaerolineaceae bacterium]|nr:transcriptional repressor LexA [Anaerolineaceae bacterium]
MATKANHKLDNLSSDILSFIKTYRTEKQISPSYSEIAKEVGIKTNSHVQYCLKKLRNLGLVDWQKGIPRSLRLCKVLDELINIPVMGKIAASKPIPMPTSDFAYYDSESTVAVASSGLPMTNNDLFALEVQGDSMIDAMVNDGDIVIIKPCDAVENGTMAAIWLTENDETTLKFFHREENRIRLQPANKEMEPIYIENPQQVQVKGRVVKVIRNYFN